MNKNRIYLIVIAVLVIAAAVFAVKALTGDDAQSNGLSGRNKNVKVVSGSEQAIVQGTVTKAGQPAAGVSVEIHEGTTDKGALVGASTTGETGMYVFGALKDGPHFVVAKGAPGVAVKVAGNGTITKDIALK